MYLLYLFCILHCKTPRNPVKVVLWSTELMRFHTREPEPAGFEQNILSINITFIGLSSRMREWTAKRLTDGVFCLCNASRSAFFDLPPLFKCRKRQFACSLPALPSRCSIWSNLPFQPHFYLIASSGTQWHRGHTLRLECRCNTNTHRLKMRNRRRRNEQERKHFWHS